MTRAALAQMSPDFVVQKTIVGRKIIPKILLACAASALVTVTSIVLKQMIGAT
jgi:hypothetical protein